MREVFRKIKAFYIQKKKLAVGVTVAILGVLTAVGVYAMIPEVKAAQGDTQSDPIVLTSGGKHSVEGGKKIRVCKKCGATLDKAFVKKSKAKQVEETEAPKKRTRKRSAKKADEETTTTADETKE